MEEPSFALVRLPGDPLDKIHCFTGPEVIKSTSIKDLSRFNGKTEFLFSPWNQTEILYKMDDFKGVFNLGEAFTWIDASHKREINQDNASFEFFAKSIEEAKIEIQSSQFEKVVLAREKFIDKDIDLTELGTVFYSLCKAHPHAFVYVFSSGNWGTWMGASPETLINYDNASVTTMSLAGTLFNEQENWSHKENQEQKVTSRFIEYCLNWNASDEVQIRELKQGQLRHLMSVYTKPWEANDIPSLFLALSPTPAVCGNPRQKALEFIETAEGFKRDLYAGFIGLRKSESLITNVNLRCAEVGTNGVRLMAGCGINKESNAEREWEETALKMRVIEEYLS